MRKLLVAVLAVIAVYGYAQESRGGTAAINVMLQTPLDAARNHAGDPVTAEVLVDMKNGDTVVIPKGALFNGKLVSVTPKSKTSKVSALEIDFDTLKVSDSVSYPIAATVQALLAKPEEKDEPTVGGGAPTQAMSGTTTGGVTSAITSGDQEKGAIIAQDAQSYHLGKIMPTTASGVHGLKDVSLKTHADTTVISSSKHDVKIAAGTQLLLHVRNR